MSKIRVLIADDHTMVREGLVAAFSSDSEIEIIGQAKDGDTAIIQADQLLPDVILMDVHMPNLNGIEAAAKIKLENPFIKILLLTMLDSRQFILEALEKNLDGYILKMADIEELRKAIFLVSEGEYYFDREITEDLLLSGMIPEERPIEEGDSLTEREREVLIFIAKGMTTTEIAENLKISNNTANNHRRNILRKLNCKNTAEIVGFAIRSGLYKI